jgi:hypothetical protein
MLHDLPTRAILALAHHEAREAIKRFSLFNHDVEGAILSFCLYDQSRAGPDPSRNTAIMYHASCFVCAATRVGRLLESLAAGDSPFSAPVRNVARLEWQKKKAFFMEFIEPRNAIEHIDSHSKDATQWRFFNLYKDQIAVIDGLSLEVSPGSLAKIRSARDVVAEAIVAEYPDPMMSLLLQLENESKNA